MKVIIPGGSGQVGTILARALQRDGHEVVVLTRKPGKAPWRGVQWDGRTLGTWANEIDGADVVINLAGRSVNCRYNAKNQRDILESRVDSTRVVGEAIARARRPPSVWLQMSTATIYAHTMGGANDETTGVISTVNTGAPQKWDFSVNVARAWEQTLEDAVTPATRKVAMRSAMVMSSDRGGIFDTLLTLVRRGLGGNAGTGKQYVSWIHHEDFVNAIRWLIEHSEIEGAVNLASPNPLPYREFMRALRDAAGVKIGLPATEWMLEIGAVFMNTETELILKSRRVVPGRLVESGFGFRYKEWGESARELVAASVNTRVASSLYSRSVSG